MAALMTRMCRSWTSIRTRVRAWVRPMPMLWSLPAWRRVSLPSASTRSARLRVWPCPSRSRIFDRYAAPSASLTASLRHGPAEGAAGKEPASKVAPRSHLQPPSLVAVLARVALFREDHDHAKVGQARAEVPLNTWRAPTRNEQVVGSIPTGGST